MNNLNLVLNALFSRFILLPNKIKLPVTQDILYTMA